MKKKILSIALALCMVLTMMPMATGVAWADTATSVTVGGVQMVSEEPTTYYKDGSVSTEEINGYTAKYEPNTGTLTLNGLNLTSGSIEATGDLTIKLVGDNNILGKTSYKKNVISVTGDLTISGPDSGTASLIAKNGINNLTTIYATEKIIINSGAQVTAEHAGNGAQAINAKGGYIEISGKNTIVDARVGSNYALLAGNIQGTITLYNINVSDGATLTATSGKKAVSGTVNGSSDKIIILGGDSKSAANSLTLKELNSDSNVYKYVYIVDSTDYSTVDAPSAEATMTYDGTVKTGVKEVTGYSLSGNKATNAGNYTATATLVSGYKWNDGTITPKKIQWSIAKASTLSSSDFVYTAPSNLTYNGTAKTATVVAGSGLYGAGNVTVKYYQGASQVANAIDAGTYTVKIDVADGDNYTTKTDVTDSSWSFTIIPADQAAPDGLDVEAPTTAGGKGKITGTTSEMEYRKEGTNAWTSCGNTETEVDPGDYYVRYKEKTNYNAGAESAKLTVPAYSAPSNPGSYVPTTEKPTIIADEGAETTLSILGTKLTIKVTDDYELVDVIVNGVSKGKVTELTGLKTGDKVEVKTEKKQEEPKEPTKEEIIAALDSSKLVARSKLITLKNGKKAVRVSWYDKNGKEVDFDGIEIYRSTQRYKGYGLKPFYATKDGKTEGYYVNTKDLKEGATYYYKVRGYVEIDGQKYYTDYSLKAIRTIK